MLDVSDLKLVAAIHEEGTITAAADRLFRSQSALSQRLQAMEERLGAKLFERGGRAMTLTPIGSRVLEAAQRVLREIDRAETDIEGMVAGRTGTLRLAAQCYACYHWLPPFLRAYRQEFPKVDVQIVAERTADPTVALMERAVDLAIVTEEARQDGRLQTTPLFDDEMVAIVPTDHPWADRTFVRAADFEDVHVILSKAEAEESLLYQKVLLPEGIRPQRVTTMPMATTAGVDLARSGVGVALMERWAALPFLDAAPPLVAVPITEHGLWRTWLAATRREDPLPLYQRRFLERLTEVVCASFGQMLRPCSPPAGVPADTQEMAQSA